eukprot:TRINITY_DN609_c0_g3_i3.p1 TRINITY_DN609_c0_g3~~TRINITY_DN609_c0_g3_i3.p1  ORF type:complete len:257 (+),score=-37.01 TRINITY_DN609_c0_g3_i3:85-855(+)
MSHKCPIQATRLRGTLHQLIIHPFIQNPIMNHTKHKSQITNSFLVQLERLTRQITHVINQAMNILKVLHIESLKLSINTTTHTLKHDMHIRYFILTERTINVRKMPLRQLCYVNDVLTTCRTPYSMVFCKQECQLYQKVNGIIKFFIYKKKHQHTQKMLIILIMMVEQTIQQYDNRKTIRYPVYIIVFFLSHIIQQVIASRKFRTLYSNTKKLLNQNRKSKIQNIYGIYVTYIRVVVTKLRQINYEIINVWIRQSR